MAERMPTGLKTFLFLALSALFTFGWYCLDVIEERREQSIRVQHLDTLRNRLPLIRGRLEAKSLVYEKMLASLHGVNTLDRKTARLIASRWVKAFGTDIRYALFDMRYRVLTSHGFNGKDLLALLIWMLSRWQSETWEKVPSFCFNRHAPSSVHLFGKMSALMDSNPISVRTVKLLGRSGLMMIGPWFPEMVLPNSARCDLQLASETTSVASVPCAGMMAVFVPHKTIATFRWLKKALDLPTSRLGLPRIHLVTQRRLLSGWTGIPGLTPELARAVNSEAEAFSEGVLLDKEMRGVAFVKKAGWSDAIALHVTEMQHPFRIARSPLMPCILVLLLAVALLATKFETRGSVAAGLLRQCLLVCAIVSCIPVSGLIWTGFIGSQSRSDSRRSDMMERLEQRLEQIEAGHASYVSSLIKPVRKFLENPEWKKGVLSPDRLAALFPPTPTSHLGMVYIIDANGTPFYYPPPVITEFRKEISQAQMLITALLQYVQKTLISNDSTGDRRRNLQSELRGGMVYDAIAMAVGPENVYQLATTFDQLMPFQMFHEITSVIFHQVLDDSLKPTLLLFAVMNRRNIVAQELLVLVNRNIRSMQDIPPLLLMQDGEQEWPLVQPIAPSMEPGINLVLRRVKSEGGNIRTILPVHGVPCYVLARPLTGMEMLGVAIEPVEQGSGTSFLPAVLAAAYPVTIVILALMLFRAFFLNPVSEMRKTVEAIAAGDYERRLPILTDDEIGSLCLSFNTMARDLAEKEFLRRFISDLTMQAVAGRHRRTATRLTATVMFTDIRSFTTMSETQPPEKITAMLNEYLTRMEAVIEAHGGTIDKFIGDAIMAVFLPTHGMAPSGERAIRAAFGMRRELASFNASRRAAGEFEIAIGSGIATGEILMGVLGRSDGRQDFTVTGPTVNISSSMEKRSKEARRTPIVACPATVEAASGHLVTEPLPEVPGKPTGFELVSIADSGVSLSHSDT